MPQVDSLNPRRRLGVSYEWGLYMCPFRKKAGKGYHTPTGLWAPTTMTNDALTKLKTLYGQRNQLDPEDGPEWISQVSTLLHELAPAQAREFDEVTPSLFAGLSDQGVKPYWEKALARIREGIAAAERQESEGAKQDAVVPSTGDRMGVFLSWSGSPSHALALILHDWIPTVLPFVDPWMSSEDIPKGSRWDAELDERLQNTSYCIVCLTPGIAREPWVNYEVGSIGKFVEQSRVSPLLLGVPQDELAELPLSRFQCTEFRKDEMLKLLESINTAAGSPVPVESLVEALDSLWIELTDRVDQIDLAGGEPSEVEAGQHTENDHSALNEVEERILVLVARMGKLHEPIDDIATQIGENQIRTEHYLDRLVAGKYLLKFINMSGEPTSYEIARQGRSYLVVNALV